MRPSALSIVFHGIVFVGEIKNNPSTHERNIVYEPSAWELTKQTCVSTVDGCPIDAKHLHGCIFHMKHVAR